MTAGQESKDFFVSYSGSDTAWAEWIGWVLEEAGYTVVLQAWDFRPGSHFVLAMQQAAEQAERTIAVLSPDFLTSRFTAPEWAAAFRRDPTGARELLLPVRVRECEPKGLLPQINYIDLLGIDDRDAARDRLLAGVKRDRAKPAGEPAFPGSAVPPGSRKIPKEPGFPGALRQPPAAGEEGLKRRLPLYKGTAPVLVGPSYLDITLYPVRTCHLEADDEHSTLNYPDIKLGGSAIFVGKYLYNHFSTRSHLITLGHCYGLRDRRTPADSADTSVKRHLSEIADMFIEKEGWIETLHLIDNPSPPAITFALHHAPNNTKTMFTYKSDTHLFTWNSVFASWPGFEQPSVVHLSGLMKTSLHDRLLESLQSVLRSNHLVIMDHGRFSPNVSHEDDWKHEIRRAIEHGLIDIHICKLNELAELYSIPIPQQSDRNWAMCDIVLQKVMDKASHSSTITIIRDYDFSRKELLASVIYYGQVYSLKDIVRGRLTFPEGQAYAANKFNAALVGQLCSSDSAIDTSGRFEDAFLDILRSSFKKMPVIS